MAPLDVGNGSERLWVVVCPSCAIVDHVVCNPSQRFCGVQYWWQVLEESVDVVMQRGLVRACNVLRELVVGVQVDVSIDQTVAMAFLFDQV